MFPFRNGSLPANALLIAIGAAAGAGVTVLVGPLVQHRQAKYALEHPSARDDDRSRSLTTSNNYSPPDATRHQAENDDARDRAATIRDAGAASAREDPAQALSLVGNYDSEQDKLEFLRGIYSVWASVDPVAALDYAKSSMPAGLARSETIGIAVNKWASVDARAAWLWTEASLSGPLKEQALNDVIIGWTRKSPSEAAQWLVSSGSNSQPLVGALTRTWAEQDLAGAAAWTSSLENTESAKTANLILASEWANQDPVAAADHFKDVVAQPDGGAIATTIADVWGTLDPAATSEWVEKLPAGPAKNEAAATLAIVWAASDIQAAVVWSGKLGDQDMRRQVIGHIGSTWGAIEPDGALNWLYSLPADISKDGISGAFNSWAATDAEGLRQWVDASPPAPEMDQARMSLADVLSSSDVGASMDLAFQLSSEKGRDDAAVRYFRHWRKTDDETAQAWLIQNWSTLAPSTRTRIAREQQRTVVAR